jgi:hypothetical protein
MTNSSSQSRKANMSNLRRIKARLREVDRHYKRKRHDFSRENLRRGEQFKLYHGRLGPAAREVDILAAIDDAMQCAPMDVDDTEAGRRVGLTLVERVQYGIRTMDACDVTAAEAKAFYAARKREQNREATKRWRLRQSENVVGMSKADLQCKKIYSILRSTSKADPQRWSTVGDLTKAVTRSRVFAGLKGKSLRALIHRALDRLAETSAIDQDTAVGSGRTTIDTRLVRLKTSTAQIIRPPVFSH